MTPEELRIAQAKAKASSPKPVVPKPMATVPAETPTEKALRIQKANEKAFGPIPVVPTSVLPNDTLGRQIYESVQAIAEDPSPQVQQKLKEMKGNYAVADGVERIYQSPRPMDTGATPTELQTALEFARDRRTDKERVIGKTIDWYDRSLAERGPGKNFYYDRQKTKPEVKPNSMALPSGPGPASGPGSAKTKTIVKPEVFREMANGDQEQREPSVSERIEKTAKGRNPLFALLEALQAGMVGFSGANIPLAYQERLARESAEEEKTQAELIRAEEKALRKAETAEERAFIREQFEAERNAKAEDFARTSGFQGGQNALDRANDLKLANARQGQAQPTANLGNVMGSMGL